ncbi:hypothetical protein D3C75_730180 [compost metagenome]
MDNIVHNRPPVGHHNAFEAPFPAQDRGVQVIVGRRPVTVHRVVRSHDRVRTALFDGDFEAFQINLAQCAFRHNRIDLAAVFLLVVAGKMLQRSIRAAFVDPAGACSSEDSGD